MEDVQIDEWYHSPLETFQMLYEYAVRCLKPNSGPTPY